MILGADPFDYSTWLLARSAGIVAYAVLSAGVLLGLAMALRLVPADQRRSAVAAHERIAIVALGFVALHGALLLFDGWLRPGLAGILVPFVLDYRPLWTGLGILGAYLTALLALSFYARRRIGARRWRQAHRLIPVAWALVSLHVLFAGTDTGSAWLLVPLLATIGGVVTLLGVRLTRPPQRAPAPAPAPVPPVAPAEPVAVHDTLWLGHALGARRER